MISYRTTRNLGLGLLLLIVILVCLVAYQRSRDVVLTLRHVVEEHTPIQQRLLRINELLMGADRTFAIYLRRDRITPEEVLTALQALAKRLHAVDAALDTERRRFAAAPSPAHRLRLYFLYYLEEEPNDPASDTVAAALRAVAQQFAVLRQQLGELGAPGGTAAGQPDVLSFRLEQAGLALDGAEAALDRYAARERVALEEVILPVEQALELLRSIRIPPDIQAAALTLSEVRQALEHYQTTLRSYAGQERADDSGRPDAALEETLLQARGKSELALSELNRALSADIREDQRQTIVQEESRQKMLLGLALGAALLALCVSYLLGRSLSARVQRLALATQRIASGELGFQLTNWSDDELGQVAKGLNAMSASLQRKDAALQAYVAKLDAANRTISDANSALEERVARRTKHLRRALVAARSANRAKDEFLAKVSHETRTPLNAILGMAELLLGTPLNQEQRRFADSLHESSESLLHMINDLLDFARIKAGKLTLERVDFDLPALVESTLDIITATAHHKGLELTCHLAPDLPRTVQGDPHRVRQILLNLLGNAVKFTDRGEVVLLAESQPGSQGIPGIRFEVTDTGIGIPEQALTGLFESFAQVDNATNRRHGGTGLGLAIVKQLVIQMGGEIGVTSRPDAGSTFWFSLPLAETGASERIGPAEDAALARVHLLVVDDNDTTRSLLARTARLSGCVAESTQDAERALARLRDARRAGRPFDVALIDAVMPGTDGITLVRHIRDDADIGPLAVIMLGETNAPSETARAALGRSVPWLNKPVGAGALVESLRVVAGLAEPATTRQRIPRLIKRPGEGAHILVADDNPVLREVICAMLEVLGHEPEAVNDGPAALAALTDKRYDLVLMDCQMPGLDGYEVTIELRRLEGASRHTPVVALTASAVESTRKRCLAAGMDDFLAKPVLQQDLVDVLARWFPRAGGGRDRLVGLSS
jgi:signal transduction histidine kinase/CheY-like chemotaxis protein